MTIKSRKLFSLDGQLSGDSIYGAARMKNLEHTISKNILLDASKEKSKIDKELKGWVEKIIYENWLFKNNYLDF